MADLSITPANVVPVAGYSFVDGIAGETLTAGQVVYLDETAGTYKKADNDAAAALATTAGIALNGASAGQPVRVFETGTLALGSILTVGVIYVLSATPGGIAPSADLGSGKRVSVLGVATSTSQLRVQRLNSGAQIA